MGALAYARTNCSRASAYSHKPLCAFGAEDLKLVPSDLTEASPETRWFLEALPDFSAQNLTALTTTPGIETSSIHDVPPGALRASWTPSLADSWPTPLHGSSLASPV